MDKGVASATVKLARKLEKLPLVAEAFAEGAISERHASIIATAATAERMAEFTNLEPEFVDVRVDVLRGEHHAFGADAAQ